MGTNRFSVRQWQNCATRQFWDGCREWDQQQNAAVTDGMGRGECACKAKRRSKYATSSCTGWTAWSKLVN